MTDGAPLPPPLVFGTVGTDHHPYDRLVRWMASWAEQRGSVARVVVQTGTTDPVPGIECIPFTTVGGLGELIGEARLVVSHGGPSTILEARRAGHLPIVAPRRPELGEHVDGHQVRFTGWMAEQGKVLLVSTEAELHATLDAALADPAFARIPPEASNREEVSAAFGELVDDLVARRRPPRSRG